MARFKRREMLYTNDITPAEAWRHYRANLEERASEVMDHILERNGWFEDFPEKKHKPE